MVSLVDLVIIPEVILVRDERIQIVVRLLEVEDTIQTPLKKDSPETTRKS